MRADRRQRYRGIPQPEVGADDGTGFSMYKMVPVVSLAKLMMVVTPISEGDIDRRLKVALDIPAEEDIISMFVGHPIMRPFPGSIVLVGFFVFSSMIRIVRTSILILQFFDSPSASSWLPCRGGKAEEG